MYIHICIIYIRLKDIFPVSIFFAYIGCYSEHLSAKTFDEIADCKRNVLTTPPFN